MNRHLLILVAIFFFTTKLSAQNVINAGVVTTQNFNSMGSSSTASLPVGWRVSIAGGGSTATYSNSPITAVTQAASSGTPTTGGVYNWGTTGGTDRSLGFLEDGYGATNAIVAQYTNNTGNPVTVITISYQAENYVETATVASVGLSYSTDDIVYTPAGTNASFASVGSTVYSFSPGRTVTRTVTIFGVNILNGQNVYFRWIVDANTPNSEGIGLDDVAISSESTTIAATLTSTITTDAPPTGKPNPGDVIAYTATITTTGSAVARNLQINEPAPNNTTLVPGSVKTSALASDDNYTTPINTPLTGTTVLANDYGLPTVSLVSYGSSAGTEGNFTPTQTSATAQGGTVVMNADGTFTYTPHASFSGYDQFYYVATTGTLPKNDAIVTISVGTPAIANSDSYPNAIGNLTITDNVLTNDAGSGPPNVTAVNGVGGNVGNPTSTAHGTVTLNSNGTFTYNPNPGYTGNDQFTYTINNAFNIPSTGTVSITLSGMIWFVNNALPNGNGTQVSPFSQTSDVTGTSVNDNIFFYQSINPYTGSITLQNGQKLIGQGASNDLPTITGLTFPSYNTFPSMTGGTVSLTASNANIITLGSGNTIRGLTVGSAGTGKKITGSGFGTLTIGNNIGPDVILNGSGEAMDLTTGTFSSSSRIASVSSSSSASQGINLSGVTSTGTMNFGSTTISGSTSQGILIGTTTANINFGNTTVTGGTDGVSFQNNSSGTRTFGTLTVSGGSGSAFLHAAGGGNVTVTGTTTLSSTIDAIDISNASDGTVVNFQSNVSATRTSSGGEGVHWSGTNPNATLTFSSLTVQTNAGTGLNLSGGGTVNVTTNTGIVNNTSQAASAIIANGIALNANFTAIKSSGGTNGVSLTNVTGTSNFGSGALSGASGATFLVDGENGTFSYSGSIGQTNTARAVDIENKTGGTVTLSGTITANTGTSSAIVLNNSSGTTVTFNGSNSSLTTTSGIGFSAVSGIVNVTGSTNTISSGTGIALLVDGATIGASGITFKSISANGGANGIFLRNTGTNGGLTVTGDGSTNSSGGVIKNMVGGDGTTSGSGVFLTNTKNVSLSWMQLNDFQNFGIYGDGVTNFTLQNSVISGVSGTTDASGVAEGAIRFGTQAVSTNGLTGTANFAGNNISGGFADNVAIYDGGAGSLNLTFQDGTNNAVIGSNSLANGNDGIHVETTGTSGTSGGGFTITVIVNGVDFTSARGDLLQVLAGGSTTQNIIITNNHFSNNHGNISSGGGGVTLSGAGNTSNYIVNYNVTGNTFTGAQGDALLAQYDGQSATVNGIIFNNTVGTPNGTFNSAQNQVGSSNGGNGIEAGSEKFAGSGTLTHAIRIEGNTVADIKNGLGGISLNSNNQSGGTEKVEATILNNIVEDAGPNQFAALYTIVGGASASDVGQMGLNIIGNTFNNSGATTGGDNAIDFDQIAATAHYYFPGYAGSGNGEFHSGTASANLNTFLTDGTHHNTLTNGGFPGFTGGGGVDATVIQNATGTSFTLTVPMIVFAPHMPHLAITPDAIVTKDKLNTVANAAIQRWAIAGATKEQIAVMHAAALNIVHLLGAFAGSSNSSAINIDNNGAGYGWFIDPTPLDDNEFIKNDNQLNADKNSAAYGRIDLLTVLMHELGHQAGLEDDYQSTGASSLMYGIIKPGERRLPDCINNKSKKEL